MVPSAESALFSLFTWFYFILPWAGSAQRISWWWWSMSNCPMSIQEKVTQNRTWLFTACLSVCIFILLVYWFFSFYLKLEIQLYSTISNKSIPNAKLEANLHLKKALFLLFLSFLHYACTAVRAPVLSPTPPPPPPPPTHKKELKMRRIHVFARMWQRELGEEEDGIVEIGYSKRERGQRERWAEKILRSPSSASARGRAGGSTFAMLIS